jgi:hypothetical protein
VRQLAAFTISTQHGIDPSNVHLVSHHLTHGIIFDTGIVMATEISGLLPVTSVIAMATEPGKRQPPERVREVY